jgi:hypothetical protein
MSGKVVSWAFEQITGSPAAKLVLVKLADNANDGGFCWVGLETIIKESELSQSAVYKHMASLQSAGLVRSFETTHPEHGYPIKAFQLSVPLAWQAIPPRGKGKMGIPPGGKTIPPDGNGSPPQGKVIPPGGIPYKDEPSSEPSLNLSQAPAGAGERNNVAELRNAEPERWLDFRKAVADTWPGGFVADDEAPARAQFERCTRRVTAETLVSCARLHGATETARKAARHDPERFFTKKPSNWLKEDRWEGYVSASDAAASQDRDQAAALASVKKSLGVGVFGILRRIGVSESELARMVGAKFEPGPPPSIVTASRFQADRLLQRINKLERELGKDLSIVVAGERRSA